MQRIWRKMFAAVAGVLAVAGAAAAQSPPPQPLPPIIPVAAPVAVPAAPAAPIPQLMPARSDTAGALPAPSAGVVADTSAAYANGVRGCNNGCGSFKQDCAFMFGSCKSFFSPCYPSADCGSGCGGGHHGGGHLGGKCGGLFGGGCGGLFGGGHCPSPPWGTPYGTGYNGCKYDSYLNH